MENRQRLVPTRPSVTTKLKLPYRDDDITFYFTIGLFLDGKPGEVFITVDNDHEGLGSAYHSLGIALSMLFQSNWTIAELVKKFAFIRSVPSGFTSNPELPNATSVVDYLVRWLETDEFKSVAIDSINTWREISENISREKKRKADGVI